MADVVVVLLFAVAVLWPGGRSTALKHWGWGLAFRVDPGVYRFCQTHLDFFALKLRLKPQSKSPNAQAKLCIQNEPPACFFDVNIHLFNRSTIS